MVLRLGVLVAAWLLLAAGSAQASVVKFSPGAPGIGDPYFPLDGNGGYDVAHYDLDFEYDPATDVLRGLATDRREGEAEPVELQPRPRRA